VYVDYGLTALKSSRDSLLLVTYSPDGIGNVKANGVLNTPDAGQPKLLSYGLQIRLTWGAKPTKQPVRAKTNHLVRGKRKEGAIAPALAPEGAPISDSELISIQQPIVFGIVGEADIPETQTPVLDDVVTIMQRHPDLRISIVGYTCDGTQQIEDGRLGDARAKAVARYFEHKGIDRRRMDISYDKEGKPSMSYDPAANFRNRKVLITPE
jgi:outer membrane protein OmpA-like peptidoglycan-associated protein